MRCINERERTICHDSLTSWQFFTTVRPSCLFDRRSVAWLALARFPAVLGLGVRLFILHPATLRAGLAVIGQWSSRAGNRANQLAGCFPSCCMLHRADETQPGRNSCPRLQFTPAIMSLFREVFHVVISLEVVHCHINIDVRFSYVCPVIDNEFRHNIV